MTYDYTFSFKLKLFTKLFVKAIKFWSISNTRQEIGVDIGTGQRVVGTIGRKKLLVKDFSVIRYDIKKALEIFKK